MRGTLTHSVCTQLYNTSLGLLTDFYQMTMASGYLKHGLAEREATFHMFFRRHPFQGGFTIAAGLENLVDFVKSFHLNASDIEYLATLKGSDKEPLFAESFLEYLSQMRFTVDIEAVPEGTVVFPYEPLVRVRGPLIQCQLLETPLLNLINFPSLIATKAARMRLAAGDDQILEFGLRRAQGIDGSLTASRAAYIGGCDSTSNVLAGKLFGIPVAGTHSHSWVMVFDDETQAFEAFADAMPANSIFLVDTYDTLAGVERAIEVGQQMRERGHSLAGVRLDSGDLTYLSVQARKLLDDAGFRETKIVASNELDENLITEMKHQGTKITVWGVGTNLVTGKDNPALDGVYKLSAIRDEAGEWQYKLKLSEQMRKVSNPGILQVSRFSRNGEYVADVIYDTELGLPSPCHIVDPLDSTRSKDLGRELDHQDLLVPIFREGSCVYECPSLPTIRQRAQDQLKRFHRSIKRFVNPHQYVVGMEQNLYDLKVGLINNIRHGAPARITKNASQQDNNL